MIDDLRIYNRALYYQILCKNIFLLYIYCDFMKKEMTLKKSYLLSLQIIFVLFSLQFLKDTFYKWDGFSYYMRFKDFLPDLSLAFVLWTLLSVIFASILWLIIYGLSRVTPKYIRIEHIIFFILFIALPVFVKKMLFSFSLRTLTGLYFFAMIVIGICWFRQKQIKGLIDGILNSLYSRITPLVWLFAILFILAIPLSVKKSFSGSVSVPDNKIYEVRDKGRPNIIMVIMDALTARDMQVYGYERPTTPFIAEWSKDAVLFKRVYSASNWTTPSTMSLLTGQRVWTHKIWHTSYYNPVGDYENNLPKILDDNGYDIYGFVQNPHAHPVALGMQQSFVVNDDPFTFRKPSGWWFDTLKKPLIKRPIVEEWIFEKNFILNKINSSRSDRSETLEPPENVYNRFLEYISQIDDGKSKGPFFAYLHVLPPHNPYLPPKPYMGIFGDSEKLNSRKKQLNPKFRPDKSYESELQPSVDVLRKRYDEFILYSDNKFAEFMSRLPAVVDMSNTIVILSSDHGESFSHNYRGHRGSELYESLTHIPLMIKMPYKTENRMIDLPVRQIDIAPTVLDLAGIAVPSWMEGRSLFPLIQGKTLPSQPVFSMQFRNNRSLDSLIETGTIAVWEGDYKLIYYLEDGEISLFNLKNDYHERKNLLRKYPEKAREMTKLINENLSLANQPDERL